MHRLAAIRSMVFAIGVAFCLLPSAGASPLTLQVTDDNPGHWRAVLSGQLDESSFPFTNGTDRWEEFASGGSNWSFLMLIDWDPTLGYYMPVVRAQHLVATSAGEAAPGLIFEYRWYYLYLETFQGSPTWTADIIHPGAVNQYDFLSIHIDDLNPGSPGLIDPTFHQISATFDLSDAVPEPGSSALAMVGFLAMLLIRKRHA